MQKYLLPFPLPLLSLLLLPFLYLLPIPILSLLPLLFLLPAPCYTLLATLYLAAIQLKTYLPMTLLILTNLLPAVSSKTPYKTTKTRTNSTMVILAKPLLISGSMRMNTSTMSPSLAVSTPPSATTHLLFQLTTFLI